MAFTVPNEASATDVDQAELDSVDLQILAQSHNGEGVISGCSVAWTSGMTMRVSAGQVSVGGYFPYLDQIDLAHSAPGSGTKYDLICVDYNGVASITAGTLDASNPVFPAIPANSIVIAAVLVKTGDAALTATRVIDKRCIVPNTFDIFDEFTGGDNVTTGDIGDLGWAFVTTGTSAIARGTAAASHPGVQTIGVSSTTNADGQSLIQGLAGTTAVITPTDVARIRAIVQMPTVTSAFFKVGMGQDCSVSTLFQWGTAGTWFEFDTSNTTVLMTLTRQGGTGTANTIGALTVTASNWYDLEIVRLQNGNYQFVANKVIRQTHSTNLPTTNCNVGFRAGTRGTAGKTLNIDFFGMNFKPLGNRYT